MDKKEACRGAMGFTCCEPTPTGDQEFSIGALLRSLREFWRALDEVDADIYVSRGLTGQAGVLAAYAKLRRRRYVFWFGKNADASYGVPWLSPLPAIERLSAWYGIREEIIQKVLLKH